ncbi:MAG: hypothetical protein JWL95_645 [Gemmatimonadetes bacterium]|nr:hypothetical protein [Gemmatimonadota bacterium]
MLSPTPDVRRPEPRWPVIVAAFSAVALHFTLPETLRVGPPWVLAIAVGILVVVAQLFRSAGRHRENSWTGYLVLALLAGGLLYGLGALLLGLVRHSESATSLLRSAAVLWLTNVIVFASWYWRLDAGGPNERERREAHTSGAFLFPQMSLSAPSDSSTSLAEDIGWRPSFVDYLFLAFNTSTALSPTDVPVLSSWAKLTMMLQSLISLTTIVLLAGRAVNLL